jgi:hypothetical protein
MEISGPNVATEAEFRAYLQTAGGKVPEQD